MPTLTVYPADSGYWYHQASGQGNAYAGAWAQMTTVAPWFGQAAPAKGTIWAIGYYGYNGTVLDNPEANGLTGATITSATLYMRLDVEYNSTGPKPEGQLHISNSEVQGVSNPPATGGNVQTLIDTAGTPTDFNNANFAGTVQQWINNPGAAYGIQFRATSGTYGGTVGGRGLSVYNGAQTNRGQITFTYEFLTRTHQMIM